MERVTITLIKDVFHFTLLAFLSMKLCIFCMLVFTDFTTAESVDYSSLLVHERKTHFVHLLYLVFFSPILETLIFCVFIYSVCQRITENKYIFILCSTLTFSRFHLVKEGHIGFILLYTSFGGLLFSYNYQKQIRRYGKSIAIGTTLFIHAAANLAVNFV